MGSRGFDRQAAAAEARLDRLDDLAISDEGPADQTATANGSGPPPGGMSADEVELVDGMHIEDADDDILAADDEDETRPHVVVDHAALLDELTEAFNARDLDVFMDVCREDCEIPGLASDLDDLGGSLDDLWERRPTITMTRGVDDMDQAHGVLWERGETAGWAAIGLLHVDVDEDGQVVVLEFSDDVGLLDELEMDAPDGDLEEGARWEEWDEGAD